MKQVLPDNTANIKRKTLNPIIIVLSLILVTGLIRIPSLTQPTGPDQGIMSVIGEGILNGQLPYRDFWEMASPAIFFTYALMFKVLGTKMAAIPITDTFVAILTTVLIYMFANCTWGTKTAFISALLFTFFSSGIRIGMHSAGDIAFGTFWYICQRESFMLPLIVGSIYCAYSYLRFKRSIWKLFLSAFLSGLSFVYKFPSLIFFACTVLYLNWCLFSEKEKQPLTTYISLNFILVAGFLSALLPFIVFFSLQGAMQDMIDIIFRYVYSVYGKMRHDFITVVSIGVSRTLFLSKENFILWLFFFSTSIDIVVNRRTKENMFLVIWALASMLYVVSHYEFFGYHYLVIFPPFSLLAGYGMVNLFGPRFSFRRLFTKEFIPLMIASSILANIVAFMAINNPHYMKFIYYMKGNITKAEYYDYFNAYPKHDYSFPADYQVAQYIIDNTDSNDMIYSLGGIESVIYFLTQKKSPSRFIFSWILFYYAHGQTKEAAEYREELLGDLKAKTPKYIITVRSLETFKPFKNIYNFISSNYSLEKIFPDDRFVYAYKDHSKYN